VEYALQHAANDEIEIVLTHCMFLTDSISELLYFDKDEIINSLRNPTFNAAFRALRVRFKHVQVNFRWEIFTGLTQSAFNRFILGNQINEAVLPQAYFPLTRVARNFDPTPYVRGSCLAVTVIPAYGSALF